MHSAPSVNFPVGRSFVHLALIVGVAWMGLVVNMLSIHAVEWPQIGVCLLWLMGVVWAVRSWIISPQGVLRWDGKTWLWQGQDGHVQICLDLQQVLLLKWQAQSGVGTQKGVVWLWLQRQSSPALWMDVRRAVYSPRPSQPSART